MADWFVQDDDAVKTLTDDQLRKRLRNGDFTGLELSRRRGEEAWTPLHQRGVFSEEVPHAGDPVAVAIRRDVTGFVAHLVSFLAVMIFLGFPWWWVFWGIGLFMHAWNTGTRVVPLLRARREALPEPAAQTVVDPFLADLEAALARLAGDEPVDEIRTRATAIHQARLALDEALAGADTAALEGERDEARARLEGSERPVDQEAYERQVRAIEDRLAVLAEASANRDRLLAQERELIHQLDGLHLARLAATETEDASVGERLTRVRQSLRAADEVEDHLARARRAEQARGT